MTMPDLPRPQDKLEILRKIPIFSPCSDEQLQLISEHSRLVEYKKGEVIYQEGQRADAFYIVASGRLQIFTMINGQKQRYTVLHNGDTFGEISLLTGESHSATVEALNDTLVLQLEKPAFEELINRIPSLVLHLSRLLSKRLRTKEQPAEAGEATIVAIYSAARGVGQTLFTVALAAALRRETNKDVVIVDFSTPEGEVNRFLGLPPQVRTLPLAPVSPWAAEVLEQDVRAHPLGFHFLYAGPATAGEEGGSVVAPLLSALTKHYQYILLDVSLDVNPTVLKALTQADLVYMVTSSSKDTVIRTSALMRQLRESISQKEEQIKVVLNLLECPGERMTSSEVTQCLGRPINHLLPDLGQPMGRITTDDLSTLLDARQAPYTLTVRRIARELGGILVGLALGSGAALGLAHIGVLKVLEREKIPIDIIAGSSVGALIGGLWASGVSADELEQMALRFKNVWDIRRMFIFDLSLPAVSLVIGAFVGIAMAAMAGFWAGFLFGLMVCVLLGLIMGPLVGGPIQGAQLTAKLESDFRGKTFEETWLPLKIVAADPIAREEVIFDSGSIADAVRASVSIPGIFKPVTRFGKLCLDGGVVNPIPVSVLKRSGATRVIAVNVFPPTAEILAHRQDLQRRRAEWEAQLASRSFPVRLLVHFKREIIRSMSPLVFDVIVRSMQSMEYQIAEIACRNADLTLRPTLAGSHWLEFYNPEKFIQRGEEEALRHLPNLKRLVGVTDYPVARPAQPGLTSLTTPPEPGTILTE